MIVISVSIENFGLECVMLAQVTPSQPMFEKLRTLPSSSKHQSPEDVYMQSSAKVRSGVMGRALKRLNYIAAELQDMERCID